MQSYSATRRAIGAFRTSERVYVVLATDPEINCDNTSRRSLRTVSETGGTKRVESLLVTLSVTTLYLYRQCLSLVAKYHNSSVRGSIELSQTRGTPAELQERVGNYTVSVCTVYW